MTTKNTVLDGRYSATYPTGFGYPPYTTGTSTTAGKYFSKSAIGGDSRNAADSVASQQQNKVRPPMRVPVKVPRAPRSAHQRVHTEPAPYAKYRVPKARARPPRMKRVMSPNSYTVSVTDRSYGVAHTLASDGYKRAETLGRPGNYYLEAEPRPPADRVLNALGKVRDKAYGSGFHPGVTAAEMPKALKMIGTSAIRIRKGLGSVLERDWRGVVRNLQIDPSKTQKVKGSIIRFKEGRQTLSKTWLELQYGWMPLLKDIEDASKFIAHQMTPQPNSPASVKVRSSWEDEQSFPPEGNRCIYSRLKTKWQIQYVITNLKTASTFTPNLASVAQVAWEKTPWSFVLDWIIPVNSYLTAMRTKADLTGLVVYTYTCERTFSKAISGTGTSRRLLSLDGDEGYEKYFFMKRTVTSVIDVPSPVADWSPASVFKTWKRAVSSVALLSQLSDKKSIKQVLKAIKNADSAGYAE